MTIAYSLPASRYTGDENRILVGIGSNGFASLILIWSGFNAIWV